MVVSAVRAKVWFGICAVVGCTEWGADDRAPVPAVTYELAEPYTTLDGIWEPLVPSTSTSQAIESDELTVTDIGRFREAGLGVRFAVGVPWMEHAELAPGFVEGTDRRSVAYVWQAADPQLIDEESPIRLEGFDALFRPQGHLTTQVFEAHVRTADRLSGLSGRPFDFALLAGDLTDGSQLNELEWVLTILGGGVIDPDSGADDDPVRGPGNDHSDPFVSDGLDVPWYAAIGNHETLYNGGFGPITDDIRAAAMGESIFEFPLFANGFRDGSTVDGDVVTEGTTIADPMRVPQRLVEVLTHLQNAPGEPPGHGLSAEAVAEGLGHFSVRPIDGRPLRLITLNTVYSQATTVGLGSLGWFDEDQHRWLADELVDAAAAGDLVIVMSHHRPDEISDVSPVSGDQLRAALQASDHVVLHVTGHGHKNEKEEVMRATGGYWELMLASTVDFPMHSRVIEIVDERNGFISIYVTNLDHNSPEDSLAHRARELAAAKRAFGTVSEDGDVEGFWARDSLSQNLLLRIAISQPLVEALAAHEWSTRIESIETLMNGL